MTDSHDLLRALCTTLLFATLAGCSIPVVRPAETDRAIKSVAVVSLLDEQTRVERIGLTAFNNKAVVVDQTGSLNLFAIETVEAQLHKSRPDWQIKNARDDVASLLLAKKAAGVSWSTQVSSYQKELAALANKLDVDWMFVVVDTAFDNNPGRGVGVRLRTMSLSNVKDATVHAICLVVLVDRNGKEITNRWAGPELAYTTVPAFNVGIDYDLAQVATPAVQEKIKSLMRERAKASLEAATKFMGY